MVYLTIQTGVILLPGAHWRLCLLVSQIFSMAISLIYFMALASLQCPYGICVYIFFNSVSNLLPDSSRTLHSVCLMCTPAQCEDEIW